jgi:hypothetical protein
MSTDFSTIDRATLNAAQGVMVAALRNRCCQWEQDSADAAAGGNLSAASLIKHWAFAADIFASKVSSEFSTLFIRSLDARFGDLTPTTHRSVTEQVQDAVALEAAASQEVPELIAA